jgi:hyperosmotically inducible periplasmic protein
MKKQQLLFASAAVSMLGLVACAHDENQRTQARPHYEMDDGLDHSKEIYNDQRNYGATPFNQGNNRRDMEITALIRQDIMAEESLSINAKNVKIITNGGRVQLRGWVNSSSEKNTVAQFANRHAGYANVSNQLTVKN